MNMIKFKINPDKLIIYYFFIGMIVSLTFFNFNLYIRIPLNIPRIIFALYHGGFWVFFGWYGSNYYKFH